MTVDNEHKEGAPPRAAPGKRRTLDDLIASQQATPEEVAELEGGPSAEEYVVSPGKVGGDLPDWAVIPNDGRFKIPKGEDLIFMRFRAATCKASARHKGDRVCVMWAITAAEERLAVIRSRGEQGLILTERAKQAIRAFDDHTADWTNMHPEGSVDRFYDEIGPKNRPLIVNAYSKLHSLSPEEYVDFLANCFASRSVGA
jgi:hypothetical protein